MRVKQICRSSDGELSGTCGVDIDAPRSTCHIFAPRFLPSLRAESTDNAPQTLSEFLQAPTLQKWELGGKAVKQGMVYRGGSG
jgi:hypothetical protein